MNTRNTYQRLSILTFAALSALGLMLVGCGEQSAEQQSTAPTSEQPSESTTTTQ